MIEEIVKIVEEAGKIYKSANKDLGIEDKGSSVNLVTKYDKMIQDFLFRELEKLVPGCTFLGEEGDENKSLTDGYCFIIDPIDGTTNFIKHFGHSAISVGLAKDREMIAGAVLDPDMNNMFYAEKGKGAYLNGEKISVSNCGIDKSLVLFGTCPYEHELAHKTFELTEKVFYKALEVRRSGSAALDICYVAAGKADLYYEMILRPWDWAAASVILTEAGGKALTFDKKEISADRIDSLVCGNENSLKDFYEILQSE
ncbi:MAG: inositol monophosphatase family protein [Eubacteriales bacterium]|nr:inositol monophosphatase family protein [Eubacteriales bacterium]